MLIEEFNDLSPEWATDALLAAAQIPRWAAWVVEARPYADRDALIRFATEATESWTETEVEAALADHPRIGEFHSGTGASAEMSSTEQAQIDHNDADLLARLAEANQRYEEKFGRIYLVRAKGRSSQELLDLLEQRLDNDPATEIGVVTEQLRQIAALRLETLIR